MGDAAFLLPVPVLRGACVALLALMLMLVLVLVLVLIIELVLECVLVLFLVKDDGEEEEEEAAGLGLAPTLVTFVVLVPSASQTVSHFQPACPHWGGSSACASVSASLVRASRSRSAWLGSGAAETAPTSREARRRKEGRSCILRGN